jgi:hypothetical protein
MAALRGELSGQLLGAPSCEGRRNITGINRKYVEQLFKEYRFEGVPNY